FQAEDGIRDKLVTGVQTCALPIYGTSFGFPRSVAWSRATRAGVSPDRAWPPAPVCGAALGLAEPRKPPPSVRATAVSPAAAATRSEERRVGKEGRCRRAGCRDEKK